MYALNCAFPLLLSALYGLWGAAIVGLAVTALVLFGTRKESWMLTPSLKPRTA